MTQLHRFGNFVKVTPAHEDLLGRSLSYTKRIVDGADPRNAKYQSVQCYTIVDGSLVAPFGLTARILSKLRSAGIEPEIVDSRTKHLPEPRYDLLDQLRDGQDGILAAIVSNECGIIEAPAGSGKSFALKQLCKMWPEANIIICCYSKEIVLQIRNDLLNLFPAHEVGLVGAGSRFTGRITCAVDKSLKHCDLEKCDILIYDEVHRAGATCTAEALAAIPECKMYGFSASPKGRSDNSDLEVESLFGRIIYKSSYQEAQKSKSVVPIEVYHFDCSWLPTIQTDVPDFMKEKVHIWTFEPRNRMIARAVRWAQKEFGEDIQVLITVKTIMHAVHIGQYLPEFKLVYAQMGQKELKKYLEKGLLSKENHPITSKEREALRDDFRSGKERRVIATGVWSTGVDFPGLNVLVRADAQSSSIANIQLPGRVTRSANGKQFGIVLDFDDAYLEALNHRWETRAAIYRKKGWKLTPVTREQLSLISI